MGEIIDVISDVTVYGSAALAFIYLIGFNRFDKAYKFFTLYLLTIAVIQLGMKAWKWYFEGQSNLFLFFYFFTLQFLWISLFYKELLKFKLMGYLLIGVFVLIGIQYWLNPGLYLRYNPLGISMTQMILVVYSLLYLYRNLTERGNFYLVNIGFLIYFSSSTLIFTAGNWAFDDDFVKSISWILVKVNVVIYFIFQILIFVEWWKHYRIPKKRLSK